MTCVECNKGELVLDRRDVPYRYKGRETFLKGLLGEYCTHCGMGYYGPQHDGNRIITEAHAFRQQVDTELEEKRAE